MTMSNDDTFLNLPAGFGGRVAILPNSANSVFVDASSNSANGRDDDPRVRFITYRGKDYTHSSNWTRNDDGTWTPVRYTDAVTQRGSFGMAKAPKTYAAAIIKMIGAGLTAWYDETNGGAAMRAAEVRRAEIDLGIAEDNVRDAQTALNDALEALKLAERRQRVMSNTHITLADDTIIDLADHDTWPDDFDPQALYDEAGAAGDLDLCATMERLGIAH
jgi:hypothetical protein